MYSPRNWPINASWFDIFPLAVLMLLFALINLSLNSFNSLSATLYRISRHSLSFPNRTHYILHCIFTRIHIYIYTYIPVWNDPNRPIGRTSGVVAAPSRPQPAPKRPCTPSTPPPERPSAPQRPCSAPEAGSPPAPTPPPFGSPTRGLDARIPDTRRSTRPPIFRRTPSLPPPPHSSTFDN